MKGFELRDLDLEAFPDVEERTIETVDFAGEQVHPLEVDTVVEHLERKGEEYSRIGNNPEGSRVKADLGSGHYLEVTNRGGGCRPGETEIRLASEKGYGARSHYESRLQTLLERERKTRKAADMAVSRMEEGENVWEVFRQQLDGRSFAEAARDNFTGDLDFNAVTTPYSFFFELKPWQDIDSDRVREYEGEMPAGEYGDESVEKYHYWFKKYLSSIAELAAHRSGEVDRDIAERWLEGSPRAGNPA